MKLEQWNKLSLGGGDDDDFDDDFEDPDEE